MDVMPLGAQLSLSGIEYYATLRPDTPLDRPKCGQCRSCCGCTNSTTGVSCMAVRFEILKSLSINFVRRRLHLNLRPGSLELRSGGKHHHLASVCRGRGSNLLCIVLLTIDASIVNPYK